MHIEFQAYPFVFFKVYTLPSFSLHYSMREGRSGNRGRAAWRHRQRGDDPILDQ